MHRVLKVRYIHEWQGEHTGNILWHENWPMRGGLFPAGHPCSGRAGSSGEVGTSPQMEAFRNRGYWASCFPEGDGITMTCGLGQTRDEVVRDIQECFGWEVEAVT